MSRPCGCCAGIEPLTPVALTNLPGRDALVYRVGTHGQFLTTMLARLSTHALADGRQPLRALRSRTPDDVAVALLDGWATVADVLSFYTERIANEGYLRTATERRSLVELGRLVGHRLRPGVAAGALLAFTLDPGAATTIPAGTGAASIPGPGELPQTFETAEELIARAEWNLVAARRSRPLALAPDAVPDTLYVRGLATGLAPGARLLVVGAAGVDPAVRTVLTVTPEPEQDRTVVTLVPEGAVILGGGGAPTPNLAAVLGLLGLPGSQPPASAADLVRSAADLFAAGSDLGPQVFAALQPNVRPALYQAMAAVEAGPPPRTDVLQALLVRAAPFGAAARRRPVLNDQGIAVRDEEWLLDDVTMLRIDVEHASAGEALLRQARILLRCGAEDFPLLVSLTVLPVSRELLLGGQVVDLTISRVGAGLPLVWDFAFTGALLVTVRIRDAVEVINGNGAAPPAVTVGATTLAVPAGTLPRHQVDQLRLTASYDGNIHVVHETVPDTRRVLPLDATYEGIVPGGWAVVERADGGPRVVSPIERVDTVARSAYNLSATVTQLTLADDWLGPQDFDRSVLSTMTVFTRSEPLPLAQRPCSTDVAGAQIELDGLYDGLRSGRRMVVTGERTDVPGGITGTEAVMIAGVGHAADPNVPGDTLHTTVHLAEPLAYTYSCATVRIHGNVARADHGETVTEVLGSGDAGRAFQAFPLRRAPVTHVAAPTAAGAQSTLEVRVDEVRWQEAADVLDLDPDSQGYTTRVDAQQRTTAEFGDGVRGARPRTGAENVTARYRVGIGAAGNVRAGQISQLRSRPLGVNGVTNPLRATGGANPDTVATARRTIPLAVRALDRLVSVADHADFALASAGIGKASACRLSDGARTLVHVTVAGVGDAPLDDGSDRLRSLRQAMVELSGGGGLVRVAPRELALVVVSARIGVHPDHRWEIVEAGVRRALLERFGFERRDLGQDVVRSDVFTAAQAVPGVTAVDVDLLATVPEGTTPYQLATLPLTGPPPSRIRVGLDRLDEARHDIVDDGAGVPETLDAIATAHATTADELRRLNPGVTEPLVVGGRLLVRRELRAAGLALLSPDVPDTLILERLP